MAKYYTNIDIQLQCLAVIGAKTTSKYFSLK